MAQSPDYARYTSRVKTETRGNIARDARNQQESANLHREEARLSPTNWNKSRIGRREALREANAHLSAARKQDKTARNERRSLRGSGR